MEPQTTCASVEVRPQRCLVIQRTPLLLHGRFCSSSGGCHCCCRVQEVTTRALAARDGALGELNVDHGWDQMLRIRFSNDSGSSLLVCRNCGGLLHGSSCICLVLG